ncbi:MAG: hypothetical protein ILO36_03355 [Abditibacteriota bacterium]|nr:hypothetical protein [Abditibacteriota bacterium]
MKVSPLRYVLAVLAAAVILAPAACVYILKKEASAIDIQSVYVDIDSLMKDYTPDFLRESFNDLPAPEPFSDTIADVPVQLELRLEALDYTHDTSEFEKAVFQKLTEEKDKQFERITAVMDASAALAARRNIAVGLLQLNPVFEEYDRAGMEKLYRLFKKNAIESLNSQARLYAASSKRRLFDTPETGAALGEASSRARLDRERNMQLFFYYMSVSDSFKQQEIQKTVDTLNGILEEQVSESRKAKIKKYDSYLEAASELFADRMTLDRKTKVAFYDMPAVSGLAAGQTAGSPGLLKERATAPDRKKHELYMLLANMAEEMGVEIVYSPERRAADYTEVFRHKLKDSWQYAPGLISDMEG